ncbi:MAG: cytochrome P450 [Flavobacteriaceae bacterium]
MHTQKKYRYPKSISVLGFLWNANSIRRNPIPFHQKYFKKLGDTFAVRVGIRRYILLTRDKDIAQHILQKGHKNYEKSKIQTTYLSKYLGNGLLTSKGDYWLRQRRLIQPAFHKQKIAQLLDSMLQTIAAEIKEMPLKQPLDIHTYMNRLAFKVVATSLFDVSISDSELLHLQAIIERVQDFLVKEVRLPHKNWWFKITGQVSKHLTLAQESRDIIQAIIEARKQSTKHHHDLLDMLLATRYEDTGEAMDMEQLIDEITILFVAGHETTANALSFALFLLAKHPEIQQRLYEEAKEITSKPLEPVQQIKEFVYTKAVIEESMRMYPPAWITDRECLEDDTIKDFHIRKGTFIGISFYELHRNPEYWKNPDQFNPERFLLKDQYPTNAYYPFGAGPRMCIGMGFAMYEMVLAVSQLILKYSFKTTQDEVQLNPLVTLKPTELLVTLTER